MQSAALAWSLPQLSSTATWASVHLLMILARSFASACASFSAASASVGATALPPASAPRQSAAASPVRHSLLRALRHFCPAFTAAETYLRPALAMAFWQLRTPESSVWHERAVFAAGDSRRCAGDRRRGGRSRGR